MESNGLGASLKSAPIEIQLTEQLKNNSKPEKANPGKGLGIGNAKDKSSASLDQVYKGLTVLAEEVLKKLQEVLGEDLPGGIASLKPEDHTADKTSQRIVDGVTALLPAFQRQNPNLEGEELISKFMSTIRGGVNQGYNEAASILGDIGAFKIDGVETGIQETMRLVEEKLKAFEEDYRIKTGLKEAPPAETPAEGSEPEPKVPGSIGSVVA